jgi:hypothetical protein
MRVEDLKNYGRPYSETLAEIPRRIEKLMKKEASKVVRGHLGLIGTLRLLLLTRKEKKRLATTDLETVKRKGLTSEFFIRYIIENTAIFSAMTKMRGLNESLLIHHEIMDRIAVPMNEVILPSVQELQRFEDPFKAFRDYLVAFFLAEKNAGLHEYVAVEDSDRAVGINVTYCAFCEIPRLCGIVEACEPGSYSDEVVFPEHLKPLGIRFVRTKTLARGGDCCDFRWERI